MSLIPCPECEGVVSDQAEICPHCGLGSPGAVAERLAAAPRPLDPIAAKEGGPVWPVVMWTGGFLVLGVLLNAAVMAGAIAQSGDWNVEGRFQWFATTSFFVTGTVGLTVGLARRLRHRPHQYWKAVALLVLGLVVGTGVVLGQARVSAGDSSTGGSPQAASAPPSTAAQRPTTTRAENPLADPNYIVECRRRFLANPHRTDCDGVFELRYLVFNYYWTEEFAPLQAEVSAAAKAGDHASAQVRCEVGRSDAARVSERLLGWEDNALRRIAIPWFQEIEYFLAACAQGQWKEANESTARIWDYLREACPMMGCVVSDN